MDDSTENPDKAAPVPNLAKGRLVKSNVFALNLREGEKPVLDVRGIRPFEVLFRAEQDDQPQDDEDLTPRVVTSLSPAGRRVEIPSAPALVLADTDGHRAGEVVWVAEALGDLLERAGRVLVSRGDNAPLRPVTAALLVLI